MIIPLAVMMVSGWKTRTVNVVWPAVLFVLAAVESVLENGAVMALVFTGINVAIILLLAAGLYGYARLRGKRLGEPIGLGDALFFIAIAPGLSPGGLYTCGHRHAALLFGSVGNTPEKVQP